MANYPTVKKRTFLKFWQATGYSTDKKKDCMEAAGFSPNTPFSHLAKNAKGVLRDLLDEEKLTLKGLVREHKRIVHGAMSPAHPDQKDDAVRLKAIKLGYGMHDVAPTQKVKVDSREDKNVTISLETIKKIQEIKGENIIDVLPEEDDGAICDIEPL